MFKIGVVGAGAIGDSHKSAIEKHPECVMTAVCDLNEEKAKILAEGTDAKIYTDYKEMIEKEELDIVILNLPHFLHKEVSIYCLDKGKHVLVEKPMACSVEECDAMIESSKRNNKKLGVGHVQRFNIAVNTVKRIIRNEELGKLCRISHTRNTDYFTNRPKWFLNKAQAGGGILMNYGAHAMDKIFTITGLKAEEVLGFGNNFVTDDDIEGGAQVLIKLEGGVSASLTFCGEKSFYTHEHIYYCTNGAVKIVSGGDVYVSKEGAPFENLGLDYAHTIFEQLKEFTKMIKEEENNMPTGEYGREVIKVLEKAFSTI